jgi:hypothetical protein
LATTTIPQPRLLAGQVHQAPFAQQDVGNRHAHILEDHLGMPVGRLVVAEHRQVAQHFAPGVSIGTMIMDCCL